MKKVIVLAALALGAGYLYNKYSKTSNDPGELPESDEVGRRELTDDEARYYADTNSDIKAAFGNDLVKIKDHWYNWGYSEGRHSPYGQGTPQALEPSTTFDILPGKEIKKKTLFS